MNDLEITKRCAETIGLTIVDDYSDVDPPVQGIAVRDGGAEFPSYRYDPLHDDAQAMALGEAYPSIFKAAVILWANDNQQGKKTSLKRIICEGIARK